MYRELLYELALAALEDKSRQDGSAIRLHKVSQKRELLAKYSSTSITSINETSNGTPKILHSDECRLDTDPSSRITDESASSKYNSTTHIETTRSDDEPIQFKNRTNLKEILDFDLSKPEKPSQMVSMASSVPNERAENSRLVSSEKRFSLCVPHEKPENLAEARRIDGTTQMPVLKSVESRLQFEDLVLKSCGPAKKEIVTASPSIAFESLKEEKLATPSSNFFVCHQEKQPGKSSMTDEKAAQEVSSASKHVSATFVNRINMSQDTEEEYQVRINKEFARITKDQRLVLCKTFALIEKEAIKNGLNVLLMLFSDQPTYKNIWPQFRHIPDSALMNAIELRHHASVYMAGLRTIIDAMDDDHQCVAHLKRIARAHLKWNIHKRHIMNMLKPILEVIATQSGMIELDAETRQAWVNLYDVIANLVDIYREMEQRRAD